MDRKKSATPSSNLNASSISNGVGSLATNNNGSLDIVVTVPESSNAAEDSSSDAEQQPQTIPLDVNPKPASASMRNEDKTADVKEAWSSVRNTAATTTARSSRQKTFTAVDATTSRPTTAGELGGHTAAVAAAAKKRRTSSLSEEIAAYRKLSLGQSSDPQAADIVPTSRQRNRGSIGNVVIPHHPPTTEMHAGTKLSDKFASFMQGQQQEAAAAVVSQNLPPNRRSTATASLYSGDVHSHRPTATAANAAGHSAAVGTLFGVRRLTNDSSMTGKRSPISDTGEEEEDDEFDGASGQFRQPATSSITKPPARTARGPSLAINTNNEIVNATLMFMKARAGGRARNNSITGGATTITEPGSIERDAEAVESQLRNVDREVIDENGEIAPQKSSFFAKHQSSSDSNGFWSQNAQQYNDGTKNVNYPSHSPLPPRLKRRRTRRAAAMRFINHWSDVIAHKAGIDTIQLLTAMEEAIYNQQRLAAEVAAAGELYPPIKSERGCARKAKRFALECCRRNTTEKQIFSEPTLITHPCASPALQNVEKDDFRDDPLSPLPEIRSSKFDATSFNSPAIIASAMISPTPISTALSAATNRSRVNFDPMSLNLQTLTRPFGENNVQFDQREKKSFSLRTLPATSVSRRGTQPSVYSKNNLQLLTETTLMNRESKKLAPIASRLLPLQPPKSSTAASNASSTSSITTRTSLKSRTQSVLSIQPHRQLVNIARQAEQMRRESAREQLQQQILQQSRKTSACYRQSFQGGGRIGGRSFSIANRSNASAGSFRVSAVRGVAAVGVPRASILTHNSSQARAGKGRQDSNATTTTNVIPRSFAEHRNSSNAESQLLQVIAEQQHLDQLSPVTEIPTTMQRSKSTLLVGGQTVSGIAQGHVVAASGAGGQIIPRKALQKDPAMRRMRSRFKILFLLVYAVSGVAMISLWIFEVLARWFLTDSPRYVALHYAGQSAVFQALITALLLEMRDSVRVKLPMIGCDDCASNVAKWRRFTVGGQEAVQYWCVTTDDDRNRMQQIGVQIASARTVADAPDSTADGVLSAYTDVISSMTASGPLEISTARGIRGEARTFFLFFAVLFFLDGLLTLWPYNLSNDTAYENAKAGFFGDSLAIDQMGKMLSAKLSTSQYRFSLEPGTSSSSQYGNMIDLVAKSENSYLYQPLENALAAARTIENPTSEYSVRFGLMQNWWQDGSIWLRDISSDFLRADYWNMLLDSNNANKTMREIIAMRFASNNAVPRPSWIGHGFRADIFVAFPVILLSVFFIVRDWRARGSLGVLLNLLLEAVYQVDCQNVRLLKAREVSRKLICFMFPAAIARRLEFSEEVQPESFLHTTIMFVEIDGFSKITQLSSPNEVVTFLNNYYAVIEELFRSHPKLTKIHTTSASSHLIASGLPIRSPSHASECCLFGLRILREFYFASLPHLVRGYEHKARVHLRLGCHSGPTVAAILGIQQVRYSIFGDTVNMAARMQEYGYPRLLVISRETATVLQRLDERGADFTTQLRGDINVKGKGRYTMHWLLGSRELNFHLEVKHEKRVYSDYSLFNTEPGTSVLYRPSKN